MISILSNLGQEKYEKDTAQSNISPIKYFPRYYNQPFAGNSGYAD
jgi:hypothetical protein